MAGLGAARELCKVGHSVTLFEKSKGLGGRVATRRINGCIVDHGAQILKPQGSSLHDIMLHELPTDDLITVEAPVRVYQNDGTILPADPRYSSEPQYSYRNGISTLAKLLFAALPPDQVTLHSETRIARIEENSHGFRLESEAGASFEGFNAVIATPPAPQTVALIRASKWNDAQEMTRRADALGSVEYHPCLTVLLGYTGSVPEPPAYALLAEDRSRPLLWLAFEQTKMPERVPNGASLLIAQLGGTFSRENYQASDAQILTDTLIELARIFGTNYAVPAWSQVKRWLYSQPTGMVPFAEINPASSRFVVCGDALRPGNGRVQEAFASGQEGANSIIRKIRP